MTEPNPDLIEVKDAFAKGEVCLIDVREASEHEEAHIEGARLVPLSELKEGNIPEDLPKDKPVYVHCRRGVRAQEATWILSNDYENIVALCYEFGQLEKAGFPVIRNEAAKSNS